MQEPESKYIGHISLTSSSAHIANEILAYFQNNIDISNLKMIGCDGTAVNTGRKSGVIRILETRLKRPLQWVICLLHANELPFRHLFQQLDGQTTGPKGFSGPIGKQLEKCEDMEIINYKKIESQLPQINFEGLSTDQKYLFEICQTAYFPKT